MTATSSITPNAVLNRVRPRMGSGVGGPNRRACLELDLRDLPNKNRLSRHLVDTHIGTHALLVGHLVWDCADFLCQALRGPNALL